MRNAMKEVSWFLTTNYCTNMLTSCDSFLTWILGHP